MCQPDQVAKIIVRDAVVRNTFHLPLTHHVSCPVHGYSVVDLSACPLSSLLLQQGNFNCSVGPDGYMLSALTCGMSPVTSITEGLQQVKPWTSCCHVDWSGAVNIVQVSNSKVHLSSVHRLLPWGYFGPSPSSTWGVLIVLFAAA